MVSKTILLVIASQGYQPLEYGHTRKMIEEAGFKVVVASNEKGYAHATPSKNHAKECNDPQCSNVGQDYTKAKVDFSLTEVNSDLYDGIFLVGGPGALEFLNNETTYAIMQKIAQAHKPFGAICISPRILAAAGLLEGKKATGWNDDHKLEAIFKKHKVRYVKEPVVIDGKLITADGPQAALAFGKAIVQILKK